MKKVFLYAYDRNNLGDDLFIHIITKRYPNVQFYLWSNKKNVRTFQTIKNLNVLDQNSNFIKMLGRIRASFVARYKAYLEQRCEVVVYIGGSLFIEYENWNQILNWWEYEAENRKFYVLGANFGPYQSDDYRNRANRIFAKMQDVCFRDRYSYELFEMNNIVRYAPDIIFNYEMPKVEDIKKQIFISVIDVASKNEGKNKLVEFEEKYIGKLVELVKWYTMEEYIVVLSSFCKAEGDEMAIEKVLNRLDNESARCVEILNYDGTNVNEVLSAMASSESIIASRFHAVILGMIAERPVYPIVYSNKTIHVLEDMEFPGEYSDIRKIQEFNVNKMKLEILPNEKLHDLKKTATLHFKKLDEILKE